ncbi:MAG: hypothetical protein KJ574_04745 [Nanoarchaeota archaeon]|nr:hypothetical protein [Nanoarchaeota archaeon]
MSDKKAQGMSINLIVVAAIALIILVVLVIIFVGKTGKFATQSGACAGRCVESDAACTGDYEKVDRFGRCLDADGKPDATYPVCCVSVQVAS